MPDATVAMTSNGGAGALFCDVMLLGTGAGVSARQIPLPRPTELSRPHWDGCRDGVLRYPALPRLRRGGVHPAAGLHGVLRRSPRVGRELGSRHRLQLHHRAPPAASRVRRALRRGDRRARGGLAHALEPRRLRSGPRSRSVCRSRWRSGRCPTRSPSPTSARASFAQRHRETRDGRSKRSRRSGSSRRATSASWTPSSGMRGPTCSPRTRSWPRPRARTRSSAAASRSCAR